MRSYEELINKNFHQYFFLSFLLFISSILFPFLGVKVTSLEAFAKIYMESDWRVFYMYLHNLERALARLGETRKSELLVVRDALKLVPANTISQNSRSSPIMSFGNQSKDFFKYLTSLMNYLVDVQLRKGAIDERRQEFRYIFGLLADYGGRI